MKKGNILEGNKKERDSAYHYIVYLKAMNEEKFVGAVLTHSNIKDNTLMEEGHFETKQENGNRYNFQFDNTHLVMGQFEKPFDWGPYTKVGKLTDEGIKFIESKINHLEPIFWEKYKNLDKA